MAAINLGRRVVEAARELVEYGNQPGGTALADRAQDGGRARPARAGGRDLELVVSGSLGSLMPIFGAWEQTVLGHAYDEVDHASMHAYYGESDGDHASSLASAVDMDHFVESVVTTIDGVGAARKSRRRISISFDEWDVRYQERDDANM